MTARVLLDCDPGHDDAIAIVVAAHHAELVGITTVAGNAPLERTTYNALVMRDLLGLDVPVHAGSPRPLVAEPRAPRSSTATAASTVPTSPHRRHRSTAATPSASSSTRVAHSTTSGWCRSAR